MKARFRWRWILFVLILPLVLIHNAIARTVQFCNDRSKPQAGLGLAFCFALCVFSWFWIRVVIGDGVGYPLTMISGWFGGVFWLRIIVGPVTYIPRIVLAW